MIRIEIPGEPVAQGRPRGFFNKHLGRAVFVDPKKSRSWKGAAQVHMREQLGADHQLITGPVRVEVIAFFTLAKSHHRKKPVGRAWKLGRPDAENVLKAVLDAATGIVWQDDSQVVDVRVRKIRAAQGEPPRVEFWIEELTMLERVARVVAHVGRRLADLATPSLFDDDEEDECDSSR